MTYEYTPMGSFGQGTPVYVESSIESGIPGVVEARQITPSGPRGPLIPIDTNFARSISGKGPQITYATEYARSIGRHGAKGPLIPLGVDEGEGTGGMRLSMWPIAVGVVAGWIALELWNKRTEESLRQNSVTRRPRW